MTDSNEFDIFKPLFSPLLLDDIERHILSPLSCLRDFGSHWILEFDLPLVKKSDIAVTVNGNSITVEAKLKETYSEEQFGTETKFEYFKKTLNLPENADSKKISAKFDNGRLSVTIPKVRTGQKIKIQ